jgi:hypothetical protein
MDARIKSGHDGWVCCSIQFSNSGIVIASEAKQSMAAAKRKKEWIASLRSQ